MCRSSGSNLRSGARPRVSQRLTILPRCTERNRSNAERNRRAGDSRTAGLGFHLSAIITRITYYQTLSRRRLLSATTRSAKLARRDALSKFKYKRKNNPHNRGNVSSWNDAPRLILSNTRYRSIIIIQHLISISTRRS